MLSSTTGRVNKLFADCLVQQRVFVNFPLELKIFYGYVIEAYIAHSVVSPLTLHVIYYK